MLVNLVKDNKDQDKKTNSLSPNSSAKNGKIDISKIELKDGSDNPACLLFDLKKVNKLFDADLNSKTGLVNSQNENSNNKTHSCIFLPNNNKENKKDLMISILLREKESADQANKVVSNLRGDDKSNSKLWISKSGDEYFNKSSNQLTYSIKSNVITITLNSKDANLDISNKLKSLANL